MLRVQETLEIIIPREGPWPKSPAPVVARPGCQDGLDVNWQGEALAEAFREFEKRVMRRALEEMENGAYPSKSPILYKPVLPSRIAP